MTKRKLIETGLAIQQRERKTSLQRLAALRLEATEEIDRLINFLDASDIDPDLEPTLGFMNGPAEEDECEVEEDWEPSLGSLGSCYGSDTNSQESWSRGGLDDLEDDPSDDEPSLGGITAGESPDDRDLEGPDEDCEPSLGWPERIDQRIGLISGQADREM